MAATAAGPTAKTAAREETDASTTPRVQGPVAPAASAPAGPATYAYDAAGRLVGVTQPSGETARYRYDPTGNLLGVDRFPSSDLSVLSVVPTSGRAGATVTINGTGFSATASANQVTFNGTTATVTAATPTSLQVEVPAAVTAGPVRVQVGGTTVTGETFTVAAAPPAVTAVSPTAGPPSTTVTLTGSGFDPVLANNVVDVNGTLAEVTAVTATSLQFVVPLGATTGDILVTTPAGGTQTPGRFSVPYPGVDAALIESVTPMTVGGAAQAVSVSTAGKAALVVFRAPDHGQVGIGLTASTFSGSIKAQVVGPQGKVVAELSGIPARDLELTHLEAGATYQLLLDPDVASDTGQVQVTLSAPAGGQLAVNGTASVTAMSRPGQDGLFSFTGQEGDDLSLGFTANSLTSYAFVDILAPDLSVLVDGYQLTTGGTADIDLPALDASGTYVIRIDPNQASTGNVTLTLSAAQTAVLTSSGAATQISITRPGQDTVVTFSGTEGEMASIGLTSSTLNQDTKFTVKDPAGNVLVDWTFLKIYSASDIDLTRLPATGTYTVRLDPASAGTGGVRLTLSPPATAGPLTANGSALTASITRPGQDAVFTFTGAAGTKVNLGLSTTLTKNAYIYVSKPDGSLLVDGRLLVAYAKGNVDLTLPADGTYRLRLDIVDAGTGNVTATLSTPLAAGEVTPTGPAKTVTISRLGQNAVLTFTGTAGQAVNFGFTSNTFTDQIYLDVVAPDGTVVVNDRSVAAYSKSDLDLLSLPASGTYQLVVDPAYGVTGSITVTGSLSVLPGELAVNGAALPATLTRAGQDAIFTFTGTSGQLLRLNVSGVASFGGSNVFVTVIKPDGTELSPYATLSADGGVTVPALPVSGSYKVVVDIGNAATGTVTLALATRTAAAAAAAARTAPTATPTPVPSPSGLTSPQLETMADEAMSKGPSWQPDRGNLSGFDWNIRRGPAQQAQALTAASGQTALAGQVRTVDGRALPRVAVRLGEARGETDAQGRFLLTGAPAGTGTLVVDGGPAGRKGVRYGHYEIKVEVAAGRTTALPYTIWMQQLDTEHMVRFPSPTTAETVLRTPKIPGLEVRIPAGSVTRDGDGRVVTELGITPIPIDRPPFPLPERGIVPVYFTVQPGGTYIFPDGAQIIYPNYTKLPAGTRVDFWNYDPERRGWYVYGKGRVSADARQVVPDPGTKVWAFHGAMFNTEFIPPWLKKWAKDFVDWLSGDPVELSSGLMSDTRTDLAVDDVMPIDVTRVMWQGDVESREFGIGTTSRYGMILHSEHQYTEVDLYIPGGGKVHYVRTSPGVSFTDAVFEARGTTGEFQGSKVWFKGNGSWVGDWRLTLRDGTEYVFPQYSRLSAVRDRYGNEIRLTRAANPTEDLTQITSPSGKWIKLSYDAQHRVVQARDNIGRTVGYTYNAAGRLEAVTDPAGKVTRYTYDSSGRLATARDGRGITYLTNEYDTAGRVLRQTLTDGQVYDFAYTTDANGQITETRVTEPGGRVRRVTFVDGLVNTDTTAYGTPLARTVTYERGADQRVDAVVDPFGRRRAYHYDARGNVTHTTTLAGTANATDSAKVTYAGPYGQPTKIVDELGKTTKFGYDQNGNLASVTDPMGRSATYVHNRAGQLTSVTDLTGETTTLAYRHGQLAGATDPAGGKTTFFSDAAGRRIAITAPDGATSRVVYDARNQVTQTVDPLGHTLTFGYDDTGNLRTLTDARQHSITWNYDDSDRVIGFTDPLGRSSSTTYNAAGRPVTTVSRKGTVTQVDYDTLNRPTRISYGVSGTTAESRTTFSYDAFDRLQQVTDTATTAPATFGYDDLDRTTQVTTANGAIGYTYDAAQRLATMTATGQAPVTYTYDDAGDVTRIAQGAQQTDIQRDGSGRVDRLDLPGSWSQNYTYDTRNRITAVTYEHGTTVKGVLNQAYGPTGDLVEATGDFARIALPQAVAGLTYDDANRLTSRGGQTLTYDNDGNLTNDGTTTYSWNARGELTGLNRTGLSAAFGYDPLGDRDRRSVAGSTRNYLNGQGNPVTEAEGNGSVTTLLSGGTDRWLARTSPTGTRAYLTDPLGSVLALGDASGQITASYAYDAYGNTSASGDPEGNALTYTGREDDGTGLMYYRARYYSPTLQRFISEDPIGVAGGTNLYAYAANSPTNYTDPTGNNPMLVGCLVGGLTDGAIDYLSQRLSGRKVDWGLSGVGGAALSGCLLGGLFGAFAKLPKFGRCLLNSFTADTPVVMADGSRKPISAVRVGDKVLAADPETGETRAEEVTALITGEGDKQLVHITVDTDGPGGTATGTVTATDGHPFWEPVLGEWLTAGRLKPGMWLRTGAGTHVQVTAVARETAHTRVYNLTIADLHTYHVLAGTASVLVHNDGCGVALGFQVHGTKQFAESRGLRHFLHPRYSGDAWRAPVQRAIGDGTVDLHVNTTGFNAGFRDMVMRGKSTGARATEEEMYWIARAVANGRREWSSVKFYDENGNILNIPEPDWSTFGRLPDFYF
ncbi:RHS repeat-associated core domain-containing protein [Microbispora sp. NPDC046973]|uniref:RHS repeat-associated core domain-containing protein n=1 Tax=Microbispora sp. NPDC046973 TaxID=3155022 RepID=UPI00340F4781